MKLLPLAGDRLSDFPRRLQHRAPNAANSSRSVSSASATTNPDAGSDMGMPVPPPGAMYTLFCCAFSGPTHIADPSRPSNISSPERD